MSPVPAAALLAALAAVALIAERGWVVAAIAVGLFAACLTAPRGRRWIYLTGTLVSALSVFVLSPFVSHIGTHVIWEGPKIPVIGYLDVTSEELAAAGIQALRLAAVGLAFAAYALLLDLDRLLQAAGFARRSVLAVGLATGWYRRSSATRPASSRRCVAEASTSTGSAGMRACSRPSSPVRWSAR